MPRRRRSHLPAPRPVPLAAVASVGHSPTEPLTRGRGRPTLLQPDREALFMDAIRGGNSIADAAAYAGLSVNTVMYWIKRARGQAKEPGKAEHQRFLALLEQNRAAARVYQVSSLFAQGRTDVRASLEWLRRFGGPEWRDVTNDPTFNTGSGGTTTVIDNRQQQVVVLTGNELNEAVRSILAAKRLTLPPEEEAPLIPANIDDGSRIRAAGLRTEGTETASR